jgi:hypothetical protein
LYSNLENNYAFVLVLDSISFIDSQDNSFICYQIFVKTIKRPIQNSCASGCSLEKNRVKFILFFYSVTLRVQHGTPTIECKIMNSVECLTEKRHLIRNYF